MRTRYVAAAMAAVVLLTAAGGCDSAEDRKAAQAVSGDQQKKYEAADPFPAAALNGQSLERKNISERLVRYNNPNKISYIYLLAENGQVISYFTIKGKVSNAGSQLLPEDDILDPCSADYCPMAVDSAGDDGSYGPDENSIFFFTTDGTLVEWDGLYLLSDRPLEIKTPVSLVAEVK
ncbi:hypothetical protein [Spongiactinospora rosea]|nr:hypothetical protein [Spongiactinospora rosea]